MRILKLSLVVVMGLMILACGRSPEMQFYILNTLPLNKNITHRYHYLQIGIDEINIPAYLEKPQLMIHNSANEVTLEEYHQWAESLDKNIKRVVETNLSTLLPGAVVENSPWDIKFKPNYHLQIDISQFTIDFKGNSILRAEYIIYFEKEIIKKQDVYYCIKLTNVTIENLVGSMNANLTHLTRDIARTFALEKRHFQ